jgi:hypothetical protein
MTVALEMWYLRSLIVDSTRTNPKFCSMTFKVNNVELVQLVFEFDLLVNNTSLYHQHLSRLKSTQLPPGDRAASNRRCNHPSVIAAATLRTLRLCEGSLCLVSAPVCLKHRSAFPSHQLIVYNTLHRELPSTLRITWR